MVPDSMMLANTGKHFSMGAAASGMKSFPAVVVALFPAMLAAQDIDGMF
jgi:hypothetical protein